MTKKLKSVIAVLLIIIFTYTIAWMQLYRMSKKYYKNAMESYDKKEYALALKGKKIEKQDRSGYEFKGGFQQVVEIWKSPYAFPKPKVYRKASNMAETLINEKIDVKTGTEIFNRYFKFDKGYLGEVMLRVGDLYLESGDKESALETFNLVEEAFPNDADILKKAEDKIKSIK